MATITIFDSDFATIWYHEEGKFIHHKVKKFFFGDEYKNYFMTGLEAVKKYHVHKWLSDDLDCPVLRKEDMEWGNVNWVPKMIEAGWKYWAIVQPAASIAQMNLKNLAKVFGEMGVVVNFTSSLDEGRMWLEKQPDS